MKGSVTKTGDGRWRLVFDLGRDVSGKRQQKVVRFRGNKKDAERKMRDLINEYQSEGYVEPSKVTVGVYLTEWLGIVKDLVAPKTWQEYEVICRVHLIPNFGSQCLQKLQPMDIQSTYGQLLKDGRQDGKKGGLSPKTIRNHHGVLSKAYSDAVKWRKTSWNPTEAVELPKREETVPEALTKEELVILLSAAKDRALYPTYLMAATTGMRRGEILALRWSDIDMEAGSVQLTRSLEETREGLRIKDLKTRGSKRNVKIPSVMISELAKVRAKQSEMILALNLDRNGEDMVFTNFDGTMRKPSLVSAEFSKLIKKLDITQTSFHGLRHSHISHLLADGQPVKTVSVRVGHANAAMTLNRYAHVMPDSQEQLADDYGNELERLMEQSENR